MKSESGRTLLEMISLLAVMGILTVSGMQLYAKAMNNIRVNHLMEKVYLMAIEIRNKKIEVHGGRRSVDVPTSAKSLAYGFSFDTAASGYNKGQKITVVVKGNFSGKICELLKDKLKENYDENSKKEFGKNGLEEIDGCNDGSNKVVFKFNPTFKVTKARTTYSAENLTIAQTKSTKQKQYLAEVKKNPSQKTEIEEKAKKEGIDLHCDMDGALTCDPLICDEDNGWYEFEDAMGHCEQCPAGYYCE